MKTVKQNIEEILDTTTDQEDSDQKYDVIVQVDTGFEKAHRNLMERAVEAIRNRGIVVEPRDIIPAVGDAFASSLKSASGKPTASAKRRFRTQRSSLAAQTALASLKGLAAKQIAQQSNNALKILHKRRGFTVPTSKTKAEGRSAYFWSSASARALLSRDELANLMDIDGDLATVHRNRRLRVPNISEPQRLPENVQDSKASPWGISATGALAAWGAYGARGAGTRVAVLDTGVDATHPDLAGKVATFAEFDGSGQLISNAPRDSDRHGTHVCGTIAGGNNSGRWIGMAPDAELAVALVLDGAIGGTDAQVLAGIDWALNQNVHAINMSLGGLSLNPIVQNTYHQAIVNALLLGIPVVTAIGNDGHQTTGLPGADLFAFAVGATDVTDNVAGFSGGRTQVITSSPFINPGFLPLPYSKPEISAPGVAVTSCVPGNDYATFNGTSMATPHVAGAVALLLSATANMINVPAQQRAFLIQDLLTGSVEKLGESGQDHRYGFGRLDILSAVGHAREQGF